MYFPLQTGKSGKSDIGFAGDDTGENISDMNFRLCELTGIYWAWKNLDADYIGLVHYHRHFTTLPLIKRLGKDLERGGERDCFNLGNEKGINVMGWKPQYTENDTIVGYAWKEPQQKAYGKGRR